MDSLGVFKRACRDTRSYLGIKWQTSIPVAYFLVGSVIHFIRFGFKEALDEGQVFLSYVVYPVFIFGGVLFLWNVFLAPFKILHEASGGHRTSENEIIKPINYEAWDQVNEFTLTQVIGFLSGGNPFHGNYSDGVAYTAMIEKAVKNGELGLSQKSLEIMASIYPGFPSSDVDALVDFKTLSTTRKILIDFFNKKEMKPPFLFPGERK